MSISIFLAACCVQAVGASYPIYAATLAPVGGGGPGVVTVLITPTGLLGVGSASGFVAGYGAHVYDGTSCDATPLMGNKYHGSGVYETPKVGSYFSNANESFSLSVTSTDTSIAGKPFIVSSSDGTKLACGILTLQTGVKSANLAPVGTSGVTGELTIYTKGEMIIGAGRAMGLEESMGDSNKGTDSNSRSIDVRSGAACTPYNMQGGRYYASGNDGAVDPWTNIGYDSTTSSGDMDFIFSVTSSLVDIANKPLIVRNNAGEQVACGVIGGAYGVFVADLQELTGSGVTGEVTVFVTPEGVLGVGTATGVGKVFITEGTGCGSFADQGNQYATSSQVPIPYNATFSFTVKTLAKDILGKPFIVTNSNGDRVACGLLAVKTGASMATLAQIGTSGVSGEVTIYATATKIIGAGAATGLHANVVADPSDPANARRVVLTAGGECTSEGTQGPHWNAGQSSALPEISYGSTDSAGATSFVFSIEATAADLGTKPFIVYNNEGDRAACGLLVAGTTDSSTVSTTGTTDTTGTTAGTTTGTTTGSTTGSTSSQVTSGCSGMPAFSVAVVLFAGMLSIYAEL